MKKISLLFFLIFFIFSIIFSLNFSSAEGYEGCGKIDFVFLADISASMGDEWKNLRHDMYLIEETYNGDGCFDVSQSFYHLKKEDYTGKHGESLILKEKYWSWAQEANSSYCNMCFISGKDKPGDNSRPKAASEAWGLGVLDLIIRTNWRENSTRVLIFYSDNYPTGGNRRNFQFYDMLVAQKINFEARKKGIQIFGFTKNMESSSKNLYGDKNKNDALELMELSVFGIGKIYSYKNASNLLPNSLKKFSKDTLLTCGYNDLGECRLGRQVCTHHNLTSDEWCVLSPCVGVIYPSQEIPDGKDNDCDGLIDE